MRLRAARFAAVSLIWVISAPLPLRAQSMQTVLNRLFIFSGGEEPLFLGGEAGIHGEHYVPAESEANGLLIGFLNEAIAANVATFPLSSTVSSQTFGFVGGVPTPTSTSFGPIFAERAQTVGRGRFNVGMNYSRVGFRRIRGVPLSDVRMTFLHQNVDFPNCDIAFGGDCSLYGIPQFEHDQIQLNLDLDMDAEIFAFFASVGVTDWLDLSLAVPVIRFTLDGTSVARITPTTGVPVFHFFGGTAEAPVLEARSTTHGKAAGIGDIAGRVKMRLSRGPGLDVSALAEIRAPTGSTEDFLGTGTTTARALLITSGTFGAFSPHLNAGYAYRGGKLEQNSIELAAGFDHWLADWATLAADLLGSLKLGKPRITFPETVAFEAPYREEIRLTNIPDRSDDILDGSLGFKLRTGSGIVLVANALVPLNDGGLRGGVIPTIGVEYSH